MVVLGAIIGWVLKNWQITLGVMAVGLIILLTNQFGDAIRDSVVNECNATQLQTELDAANASLIVERNLNGEIQKELALAQSEAIEQATFITALQDTVRTGQVPEADGSLSNRTRVFMTLLNQRAATLQEELSDNE